MKRLVFVLLFLFAVQSTAGAFPAISEDFYLNNERLFDESAKEVINILPSTLRLSITQGETHEVYADVLPEQAPESGLTWSLPERAGIIDIYPNGARCTILGLSAGEESLCVSAEGGASANVAVEVTEPREIRTRSFDYEGESRTEVRFTDKVMQAILRLLITLGAAMLVAAAVLIVKRRGWKDR